MSPPPGPDQNMQIWPCFDLQYFFLSNLNVCTLILPEGFWDVCRYMECKPSSCSDKDYFPTCERLPDRLAKVDEIRSDLLANTDKIHSV